MQELKKKYLFLKNLSTSSSRISVLLLLGLILIGFGVFLFKNELVVGGDKVEVLNSVTESGGADKEIIVEIAGAIQKPGVYRLPQNSRIDDLLIISGGVSVDADRNWIEKNINRAAKLNDGQKIYIVSQSEVLSANTEVGIKLDQADFGTQKDGLININTATLKELDSLPGIGPVYGQSIIEHRPYSITEELRTKGVVNKNVYEKIKNLISVN